MDAETGVGILRAIGEFAESMKPVESPEARVLRSIGAAVPPDRLIALERENAELRVENARLVELVRFLDQYRPRESAA